jgi:hypothetical protein
MQNGRRLMLKRRQHILERIAHIERLFDELFAHVEWLEKNLNPQDPHDWGNQHGSMDLALFHLSTSRNLLKKCPGGLLRRPSRIADATQSHVNGRSP